MRDTTMGWRDAGAPNVSRSSDTRMPKGWYSRGYLPHLDAGDIVQMVTFRLADSFPQHMLVSWARELSRMPKHEADVERYRRVESYLDKGGGEAILRNPRFADLVQQSLLYFDGDHYRLHAWVIMPNHVHVLMTLGHEHSLPAIVQAWKSYTAHVANRLLHRHGDFWHRDYYDRYIRDDRHYIAVVAYIEENPVRAGLCSNNEDWAFSSASYAR